MSSVKLTTTAGNGGTVELKGPANTTSNAAVQLTLPVDDGTANQVLTTNGSGALSWAAPVIADDSIVEAKLDVSNAPTNGQFLQAQSGEGGGLTWAAIPAGVGGATAVGFDDGVKISLGTGDDWEMYHTGAINKFESESHRLIISGAADQNVDIMKTQSEYMAKFIPDGAVELYYDDSKKFETTTGGATLTGKLIIGSGMAAHDDANDFVISNDAAISGLSINNAANGYGCINFGDADDNDIGRIAYAHNGDHMKFQVNAGTRMEIEDTGDVKINDGNLIIGTGGHGIDFSAQTASSATGASATVELLDHYEEGTWTPDPYTGTCSHDHSYYVRIGTQVTVWTELSSFSDTSTQSNVQIQGLPFASNGNVLTLVGHCLTNYAADGDGANSLLFNAYSMLLPYGGGTGAHAHVNYADISSSTTMYITATYFAN